MSDLALLLKTSLYQQQGIVLGLAFAGGVVSSLLPCTVGMLPVLIGYVGGYAENSRWEVFRQVMLFVLGVATVMTALGVVVSLAGLTFGSVGRGWYFVVGGLALFMGLQLLGLVRIPLPQLITKLPESKPGQVLAPFLLGLAFGAASSPCGTPFLTVILGFISYGKNPVLGAASLFSYALGQSMLLVVIGLFTGFLKHMAVLRHVGRVMNTLSAVVFILGGLLLIAKAAQWLDAFAFY